MKKHLNIKTKVNFDQVFDNLNKLIQEPNVSILDLGLKKKYSGEIDGNKFWFTWSKTIDFTKSRPVVKGQISKSKTDTSIDMTIKDYSGYLVMIFAIIFFITLFFFGTNSIKSQNYKSVQAIIGIAFLIVTISILNFFRVKKGMKQIEMELRQIFITNEAK